MKMSYWLYVVILCSVMCSCSGRFSPAVDMAATPILTASARYAVVVNSYVPVRDTPYPNSVIVRYLRNGDIEKVIGTESVPGSAKNERIMWLKLTDGWVQLRDMLVFDRESQAVTAATGTEK